MNSKTRSRKRNPAKRKPRKKETTTTAVAVVKPALPASTSLNVDNIEHVVMFAAQLKKHIVDNKLSVRIGNDDFPKVDAWKFAGNRFGLKPIPEKAIARHQPGQSILILMAPMQYTKKDNSKYWKDTVVYVGFTTDDAGITLARENIALNKLNIVRELVRPYFAYECGCDIIHMGDETRVTYGQGFCDNMEEGKELSSESAIMGTAVTRSIGRGFKNLLGFVMTSAGFQPTIAEEMKGSTTGGQAEPEEKGKPLPSIKPEMEIDIIKMLQTGSTLAEIKQAYFVNPEQEKAFAKFDKTITK